MPQNNRHIAPTALAISGAVVLASFMWQGHKGFSLWDEGFLWYGVQRVLAGEVPIRDFMAYDPARYYWVALLVGLFGDSGIMSVRGAVAVFQWLGLATGIYLVACSLGLRRRGDFLYVLLAAATLLVWMFPRHKLFDIAISMLLIGMLAALVARPTRVAFFLTGVGVGLIAVFGRNHGVYGAAGSVGVFAWLYLKDRPDLRWFDAGTSWAAGVALGFSPVLWMAVAVPGFGVAFWDSVRFLFENKATNLPLPVPWPWTARLGSVPAGEAARGVLVGLFFLSTLVFAALSLAWVVSRRLSGRPVQPVLVACAVLALPYAHYAFSRADVGHLAHGIFPVLIGCFALLAGRPAKVKWPAALALAAASFWVMHVFHPGWYCLASKQCGPVEIAGRQLLVDPGTAKDVAMLRELAAAHAPNGRSLVVAPFWPGAYALLERRSPVWEIYALFSRSPSFEAREIERIAAADPGLVVVFDFALDGRDELRFKNTHPLTHAYIVKNFDPVFGDRNPAYNIYKARAVKQ